MPRTERWSTPTDRGGPQLSRPNTDARINGRHASSILEMRSEVLPLSVLSISTYWSMETLTLVCKSALGAEGSQPSWQEERASPGKWASVLSGVWWTRTESRSPRNFCFWRCLKSSFVWKENEHNDIVRRIDILFLCNDTTTLYNALSKLNFKWQNIERACWQFSNGIHYLRCVDASSPPEGSVNVSTLAFLVKYCVLIFYYSWNVLRSLYSTHWHQFQLCF